MICSRVRLRNCHPGSLSYSVDIIGYALISISSNIAVRRQLATMKELFNISSILYDELTYRRYTVQCRFSLLTAEFTLQTKTMILMDCAMQFLLQTST